MNNFTLPFNYTTPETTTKIVEQTTTGISSDGQLIIALFIIIVTIYIIVNSNKEKYSHWKNPKGREVNLVRLTRILLYGYTIIIILSFLITKFILGA